MSWDVSNILLLLIIIANFYLDLLSFLGTYINTKFLYKLRYLFSVLAVNNFNRLLALKTKDVYLYSKQQLY